MAIYHFSVKTISRSDGRSAVAAAAYRAAEKLECDHYGKTQDYTKKSGVELTQIYAPENTHPDLLDREKLWNLVEKSENRKDALLAREFEIAFPQELDQQQRQAMLSELCQDLVKRHGVIVDAAIHAPHTEGGSDDRNYHAHIMFTTRAIDAETGFLSSKKYRDFSRDKGTKTVCEWREHFAELTNNHLALAGHDVRVDHRSYKDQGLELEATQHEGPEVTQLRRQGIETEISLKNNSIKARNHELKEIEKVLSGLDQEIFASENLQSKLQAALEAKQLEKQRLEAEQDQIQRDIAKFYDLQSKYINFANQSFDLQREKEKAIEPIIKRRNKIEKITLKYADADATISREYSAMQNKYGEIPDFWISKQDAQKQVKKIEANYAEQLQNLSKEIGFLTLATELTQIYRSLKSQKIDLEIPRQKKIFGIAVSPVIPPSAETLAADLEAHFFQPLGYDFETSFKQAIKTSEQKRKDAEKQRKEKIEQDTRLQQENSLRLEREARIAEHEAEIRRMQKACGYRPNCEYAAVDPHINLLTRLIASNILKKQDVSAYIAEKAIRIEGELEKVFTLSEANKIYPEYLQMLEADKQLLKQNSDKNFEKISALYELVSKKYSEKIEKEQMFMEKSLKTSPPVSQNRITSNKNLDSNNSNDLSM